MYQKYNQYQRAALMVEMLVVKMAEMMASLIIAMMVALLK
jgi:hypothetical protein